MKKNNVLKVPENLSDSDGTTNIGIKPSNNKDKKEKFFKKPVVMLRR